MNEKDIGFTKLRFQDLSFLNRVRNDSIRFLHDNTKYNLFQTVSWYFKTKPEFFIITHAGERIGYIRTSNKEKRSIYIGIDLDEKYRNKGIGFLCYTKLFQEPRLFDVDIYYMEVLGSNPRAMSLYNKLGFVTTSKELFFRKGCFEVNYTMKKDM